MKDVEKESKEEVKNAVQLLEKGEVDTKKNVEKMEQEESKKEEPNKQEQKKDENQDVQELKESNEETENKQEENKKENIEIKTLEKSVIQSENNKGSKANIILLIIGILVVLVAIFSTIFAIINLNNNKIMKGVTIGKIDVSNLTKEESKETLNTYYTAKLENQIYLIYGEFESAITYKALEVKYQIEEAVNRAYGVGRERNIFKDNIQILQSWTQGRNIKINVTIDQDMISQIAQNINNSIEGAVVQSSYYIENGNLIITSGKEGIKVDEEKLLENIYQTINEDTEKEQTIEIPVKKATPEVIDIETIHGEVYKQVQDAYYTKDPFEIHPESDGIDFDVESAKAMLAEEKEEYIIPLIITKPTKTVKQIGTEAFPDLLATFSTKYTASNVNRTTNLRLAAQKINGTVLLPGEEFSYNKVVGERTIQAGYKEAAVFSNGKVENGLGGGICQISSTLYDAVVMANLNVTVRRNHQFVTSYLPAGKDATVVWGSQDFKFVNTRKYPVRIEATVSGGVATVTIWGIKEEVEYDISIETKKIATIAYTTQYIQDPSLPAGKEVVQQAGSNGRKVEAYKVVKLNGQVISRTLLSRDTYNAMKKIVRVGTGG